MERMRKLSRRGDPSSIPASIPAPAPTLPLSIFDEDEAGAGQFQHRNTQQTERLFGKRSMYSSHSYLECSMVRLSPSRFTLRYPIPIILVKPAPTIARAAVASLKRREHMPCSPSSLRQSDCTVLGIPPY
jgi:hypothetical protein